MNLLLLIILLNVGALTQNQSPTCQPVPSNFSYPKSPNIYVLDLRRVGMLRGRVTGPRGVEITGPVLVEMVRGRDDEWRVAACFAAPNGAFNFGRMKRGRYHLRISMNGFDTAYMQVKVGRSRKKGLAVELQPST
jgi:hypothetical protein